jgi:hypothetical protein
MTQDEEQLKLLSVFHYVVAGLAALFALFPIFHMILGLIMIFAPDSLGGKGSPPPAFFGWFMVAFAAVFICAGWIFAVLVFLNGHFLAQRKHHMFCVVMGAVECIFMPFGTVLGAFTLAVILRESVKKLFIAGTTPPQASPIS